MDKPIGSGATPACDGVVGRRATHCLLASVAFIAIQAFAQDASPPVKNGDVSTLQVSKSEIAFGKQKLDEGSVSRTLKLTAPPATGVVVDDIRATDGFKVDPPSCNLAPGGSCALSVTFAPWRAGETDGAITVADEGKTTRVIATLTGEGIGPRCKMADWLSCGGWRGLMPVGLLVVFYWIALIAVRWNVIAVPSRGLLAAEVAALRARYPKETKPASAPGDPQPTAPMIAGLLNQADNLASVRGFHPLHLDVLFWSRGQESIGWSLVHEAEEQLANRMSVDDVRTSLERSECTLRKSDKTCDNDLAALIRTELAKTVTVLNDPYRSLLAESLDYLNRIDAGMRTDVATFLATPPGPADFTTFGNRLLTALAAQTALLTTRSAAVVAIAPSTTSPEFDMLVGHLASVVLPRATALVAAFSMAVSVVPPVVPVNGIALLADASGFFALADATMQRIEAALAAAPVVPVDRWKALNAEALGVIYEKRDNEYAGLLSWHNKTIWLIQCGLILIFALAATLEHSVFFLLGAVGGLLSRLSRSLYRAEVRTDYGASWTTLFLSPIVGAMAGWCGLLLAGLAVQAGVLGTVFKDVSWDQPYTVLAMGLAFLFGFSERLFDTVLSQLDQKVLGKAGTDATAKLAITTDATLPAGKASSDYTTSLVATGGKAGYTWKCDAGLPPGIKLDATAGTLSGRPAAAGSFKFVVQVSDAAAGTATKEFTLVISQ